MTPKKLNPAEKPQKEVTPTNQTVHNLRNILTPDKNKKLNSAEKPKKEGTSTNQTVHDLRNILSQDKNKKLNPAETPKKEVTPTNQTVHSLRSILTSDRNKKLNSVENPKKEVTPTNQTKKMMPGRMGSMPMGAENPLGLSWHDSNWIPILNPGNVMDYFSERSNPFFDRTCNNELIKMQRLNPEQLNNMLGLEYILLHVQEPILYVIRKQHRHSTTQVTPLADYYIIAGIVYQAPDLASVLSSRLLSAVHHLQLSFEEASTYSRYHASKGYYWDFKPKTGIDRVGGGGVSSSAAKDSSGLPKEEPATTFQRQRVDMLLGELVRQFPLPQISQTETKMANGSNIKTEGTSDAKNGDAAISANIKIKEEPGEPSSSATSNGTTITNGPSNPIQQEIKQESMKPPPERKQRM